MTVANFGLYQAIADELALHVPDGVQVQPVDPAEETKVRAGSIWVDEVNVTSEWRCLGGGAARTHQRRSESGEVKLMCLCYAEGRTAQEAGAKGRAIVDEIIAAVEQAVEANNTFDNHVDWTRLSRIRHRLWPAASGWTSGAEVYLDIQSRP